LYESYGGAMMSKMLHSLLLVPWEYVEPLMPLLLNLLSALDGLTRLLPITTHLDLDFFSSGW